MIAMQYSFVLPTDYDMNIIRHRITSKGHFLDQCPDLLFKAYLYACKSDQTSGIQDNLYAPFYLWKNMTGMEDFLCSNGFKGVTDAFGRPSVTVWIPWVNHVTPASSRATHATKTTIMLPSDSILAKVREQENSAAEALLQYQGAIAVVIAFDPTAWSFVRFCLWEHTENIPKDAATLLYQVGYLSEPKFD